LIRLVVLIFMLPKE